MFLVPFIIIPCLTCIYLLKKAIKYMGMQHPWQVGKDRGEHKNSATKTFLKHLYWPKACLQGHSLALTEWRGIGAGLGTHYSI